MLALYGGWGDGKSSVKGMVVDAMKQDSNKCPFIVHFNPWEWAGQNQLAQVFFDEIGKQIAHQGSDEEKKKAEECGRKLRNLGKYLNLTGSIVTPVMYAASLAFPVASIFAPVMSKMFKRSGDLAQQAAEAVQEKTEREDSDLMTVKSELKQALTALNRNVVVLVDDIDRLAADEIKLLFQLIKSNSDFPNLIFFLFFQRDIIERALGKTMGTGTGKEYLEKIVQVPLSLPHIQRPLLDAFMEDKLRELIARRGLEKNFHWPRFKLLWQKGLSAYFLNMRDAVRFFGTLEFQVAAFAAPNEFDPTDLFALEVFRVFEAGVYNVLAGSRHLFTADDFAQFQLDPENLDVTEPWEKSIKQIVHDGKATRPEAATAVLKSLFPIESFARGLPKPGKLGHLQKEARVGHPEFFGRYFHLCVPQGDISQIEVLKLLNEIGNSDEFKRLLLGFDKQHLALQALVRLAAYADKFDPKDARHISVAVYDVADDLVGKYSEDLWTGYAAMSCQLVETHLDKLSLSAKRFAILNAAFEKTTGIYLPAYHLSREGSRENEYIRKDEPAKISRDQSRVLTREQLNDLRNICVGKFERAVESNDLNDHTNLKEILEWWHRWSPDSGAAKTYFRKLAMTDDGLKTILDQFLGRKLTDGEDRHFMDRLFDRGLIDFEQFMPVDELKERVEEVSRTKLSEQHIKLFGTFMELYEESVPNRRFIPPEGPIECESAKEKNDSDSPHAGGPKGGGDRSH